MGSCSSANVKKSIISLDDEQRGFKKKETTGATSMQNEPVGNGEIHGNIQLGTFRLKFKRRPNRLSTEEQNKRYKEDARALRDSILRGDRPYVYEYTSRYFGISWENPDEESDGEEKRDSKSIDKHDQELITIIYRFFTKLGGRGSISRGDPNVQPFPLPDDVNPLDFREWIYEDYQPIYTSIDGEAAWACVEPWGLALGDVHTQFAASLRPWLKSWKPFDTKMTEPKYIRSHIITDDNLTEEQLRILESRSRRDMTDEAGMSRRREELMHYFQQNYRHFDATKYSNFTKSLKESQIQLDKLSTERILID